MFEDTKRHSRLSALSRENPGYPKSENAGFISTYYMHDIPGCCSRSGWSFISVAEQGHAGGICLQVLVQEETVLKISWRSFELLSNTEGKYGTETMSEITGQ